ncbi:hypothetical protein ARSEF4850_002866 [Beauveria asiatica]
MNEKLPISEIWALTYPRLNLNDHTLDDNLPELTLGQEYVPLKPPRGGAGALGRLPTELVQEILFQLDLQTLTDFRPVNRRAWELTTYLPRYRAILKYASTALRAILKTGTGDGSRAENCLTSFAAQSAKNAAILLDTSTRASRKFALINAVLDGLPNMRAVPGIYSPNENKIATRMALVDYEAARRAGIALYGSLTAMKRRVRDSGNESKADPFDGMSGNPLRLAAIVQLPWLNRTTEIMDPRFHCLGCQRARERPLHYRRRFTDVSFGKHLHMSGSIQADGEQSYRHLDDGKGETSHDS